VRMWVRDWPGSTPALDVEEELQFAGVGPRWDISLRADNRRLPVRLFDVAEDHVERSHRAFEHQLVAVALFERIAAGCDDDHTLSPLDLAREDEIRQRKSLRFSRQTGTCADLPDIVMSLDDDEIVRPFGGSGLAAAQTGKQRASSYASKRVAPGSLVRHDLFVYTE